VTAESSYNNDFFAMQRGGSARAAAAVVPWLVETFKPKRIVDVGCGVGTWSAAFLAQGVPDVLGIDGAYVDQKLLQIPVDKFRILDLSDISITSLPEQFDVSICLEVAEHLPPSRSESFVRFVTSLAPIAVFGAAIPGQPGVDHINLRWQSYWAGLFANHGFLACDILRPRFWDSGFDYWYAQNTIIYVSKDLDLKFDNAADLGVLDMAHPRLVEALCEKIGGGKPRRTWLKKLRKRLKVHLPGAT
jgi:SAM-dependent methyltransferase